MRKNCSSDRENVIEINKTIFSNSERTIFETEYFLNLLLMVLNRFNAMKMLIVSNNWDVETYRNKLEKIVTD